uniref:Thioesterase domain-containing protein n=1 Tax=Candidatus Kentrum sp. TUN TaxID=2126343 RepID=A0A450ZQJ7_9GAMM|nr:MAG: hypothetical protein BECKTUN1418F_GA0071002_10792 [Candidatus Kentron sp. TUN]VFK56333.1 MAG: hypothetical protein BECKTUN1418D_GA0071000_104417 [Candidatus Kentron sp. TUN]VFK62220.1 MAG: hypothetical protein BECKTUN1418E_GA0071001_10762 [Candidatus Kentron sp. TUN]
MALGDSIAPSQHKAQLKEKDENERMSRILMAEHEGKTSLSCRSDSPNRSEQRVEKQINMEGFDRFDDSVRIYQANLQAFLSYQPSPWKGPLVFLAATETEPADTILGMHPDPIMWKDIANRIEHHAIPGNHFTMHKQPNVREVANILERYLKK